MVLDSAVLSRIRSGMSGLRQATSSDAVGNDECAYSFDSPYSPGGLFTNLKTFKGVGRAWLEADARSSGGVLYLHQKWRLVPKQRSDDGEVAAQGEQQQQPTVLGVGVAGGFAQPEDGVETVKDASLAVMAADGGGVLAMVPLSSESADLLPEFVRIVAQSVVEHAGSGGASSAVAQWALGEDGPPPTSKYAASLYQVPSPRRVPADPRQWRCELSGDSDNLWLNLSDGYIGGGRDQSAYGGPKGSNGALRHFEDTGYPLVVKLGTISASSTAEVFSYAPDEDGRVDDPLLEQHLAHFGIDPRGLRKTEKTTNELEIDANAKFEWSAIAEAGEKLVPLSEAGKIGLVNLGNSCYLNSVVQLLARVPELEDRYGSSNALGADPDAGDVLAQASKLFTAILSDAYAKPKDALQRAALRLSHTPPPPPDKDDEEEQQAPPKALGSPQQQQQQQQATEAELTADKAATVAPRAFKRAVAGSHVEFGTGRQQDAAEYLDYLVEVLQRAERPALRDGGRLSSSTYTEPTRSLFEFGIEERTECQASNRARYKSSTALCLDLPVPRDRVLAKGGGGDDDDKGEPDAKRTKTDDEGASSSSRHKSTATTDPPPPQAPSLEFGACLEAWAAESVIDDFFSSATKTKGRASRTVRLATCPRYLLVKLNRYYVDVETWEPKKLAVEIDVPTELDLTPLLARNVPRDPNEPLLPDDDDDDGQAPHGGSAEVAVVPDETILAQLVSMGFDENGCRRACVATNNAGAEAAMEWVLTHSDDADFAAPIAAPTAAEAPAAAPRARDEAAIAEIASLGFTPDQAEAALKACDGNKERAADWIFSHLDDLDAACRAVLEGGDKAAAAAAGSAAQGGGDEGKSVLDDGPPTYSLVGFVSHIGKTTAAGHYIAHLKLDDGHFYIFDDEKVAKSLKPPLKLGYLYLYKRSDHDDAPRA